MKLTEYHYVYYSYEEYDRGYIGSRTCKCLPEEDIKYFGSFKDKAFKPTQKIILKSDYATREEAYTDEIILQQYYKVVENPHFANRAYQTSTKFNYTPSFEEASVKGKLLYENGKGIFGRSKEQINEDAKRSGKITKELGVGIFNLTDEERKEIQKKSAEVNKKNKTGIFGISKEQRVETSKKVGEKMKKEKLGYCGLSKEERIAAGKIGGKISGSQKWICLETGFITNAGNLTKYQRKQGIDTSKRKRVS
jgi:hypothetical protein